VLEEEPPAEEPVAEVRTPRRSRRKAAVEPELTSMAEPALEDAATTVLPLDEIAEHGALAAPEANAGDVWVIDGRPRYHLESCAIIQGQDAEPIPLAQATEDGFMPCSLCEPNVVRAS